jgi:hypothetical protein
MSERFSKRRSTNAVAPDVRAVARLLGGDVIGADRVLAPGPGHSHKDRSLSVLLTPSAPDGLVVHSFAGDDPLACKDYVRRMLGQGKNASAGLQIRLPALWHSVALMKMLTGDSVGYFEQRTPLASTAAELDARG